MELIANGESWKEISKITNDQGHSGMSLSLLGQTMIYYSPEGINFADKVIGSEWIDILESLKQTYKKEKRKVKSKQLVRQYSRVRIPYRSPN